MKAQSKVYIQLQGIYKAKARKDAAEILQIAQAAPGGEHVDPAEVDLFCRNAAFVKLINATGAEISRADRLKSAAGKQNPSRPARSTVTGLGLPGRRPP
jgi:amyloid beta precursor protein binding protein 1